MATKFKDMNGYHQLNNFNSFDYQSYMMKPHQGFYTGHHQYENYKSHIDSLDQLSNVFGKNSSILLIISDRIQIFRPSL